jgi:signal peptidase I
MQPPPQPRSPTDRKYRVLLVLACLAAPLFLAWMVGVRAYVIAAGSMEDTLQIGDRVLVETITAQLGQLPKRGEIVAMYYPIDRRQRFFKRVVGIPGDRLRIVDKQLYRNGVAVAEPYARHKTDYVDAYRDNFPGTPNQLVLAPATQMLKDNVRNGELIVPPGKYFVVGDNRDLSLDSRYFGFIAKGDIFGRPLLIYFSRSMDRIFRPL